MTISSSLAAGVAGLNANAQRLASISDNIANSATSGYKRSVTDFHAMVAAGRGTQAYTAGGVRTSTLQLIDQRGQLENSTNATDISINGRGFLPVTDFRALDQAGTPPLSLMTTGSFRPDDNGVLTNANGMVLMGWPAAPDGTFPPVSRDSGANLRPINILHNQYSANPTTRASIGVNLPAASAVPGAPGAPESLTMEYFGNLGQPESLRFEFTPAAATGGAANTWRMKIIDLAGGTPTDIGEYDLTFRDAATGGGLLDSVVPVGGAPAYNADGSVELTLAGGNKMELNVGKLGEVGGLTQLSSSFAPVNLAKNGSAVGTLTGVEIDPSGVMSAIYDSGFTRPIYRVPVIDVPNPNGLQAQDGQTYKLTLDSGPMFLWDAGDGPVGGTVGYSREASTTDVANELTQLIQTQRAYSSNAKIIQTVDEMLQETTNLKR
ncbi:flagellar hook protein FlgE [Oceaniovalibus guishaninsula JLT2003]|uniref:Flagellar hook protein FlgE n=1 Tax=Oceaniovalibus guishaninsula JLT2003 TaxID=1231392 RepID=K2I6U6_9RHOB|nr:flagellar hook-basal body complex protein [Oceaniovalibus guishaninsula]EKE44705.1 flagellar hook protein FlgE [Oceaniovalibus guishaninsula JLT2003]